MNKVQAKEAAISGQDDLLKIQARNWPTPELRVRDISHTPFLLADTTNKLLIGAPNRLKWLMTAHQRLSQ